MGMLDSGFFASTGESQLDIEKQKAKENLKNDVAESESESNGFDFSKNFKPAEEPSSQGRIEGLEYKNEALIPKSGKNVQLPIDVGRYLNGEPIPSTNSKGEPWSAPELQAIKTIGSAAYIEGIKKEDLKDIGAYQFNNTNLGQRLQIEGAHLAQGLWNGMVGMAASIVDLTAKGGVSPAYPVFNYDPKFHENDIQRANEQQYQDELTQKFFTKASQKVGDVIGNSAGDMPLPKSFENENVLESAWKHPFSGGYANLVDQIMGGIGYTAGSMGGASLVGKTLQGVASLEQPLARAAELAVKDGAAATIEDANVLIQQGEGRKYVADALAKTAPTAASSESPVLIMAPTLGESMSEGISAGETFDKEMAKAGVVSDRADYEKRKANGERVSYLSPEEYLARKTHVENSTTMMNFPILLVDNILVYGKYIPGMKGAGEILSSKTNGMFSKGIVKKGEEYVANKATKFKGVGEVLIDMAAEEGEEKHQTAASNAAVDYEKKLMGIKEGKDGLSYMDAMSNKKAGDDTASLVNIFAGQLYDQYATKEGWKNFGVTAISTAVGIPTFAKNAKYKSKQEGGTLNERLFKGRDIMQGGIFQIREGNREYKENTEKADVLNKIIQSDDYKRMYTHNVVDNYYGDKKQEATDNGDAHGYESADNKQLINDILAFKNAGKMDDFVKGMDNASKMTPDEVREQFKGGQNNFDGMSDEKIKSATMKLFSDMRQFTDQVSDIHDNVKGMLVGQSEDAVNNMTMLIASTKHTDGEIAKLSSAIESKLGKPIIDSEKAFAESKPMSMSDYFGLKGKNGETNANKFKKDIEEHIKKNPQDIDLANMANLLVGYANERIGLVKQIEHYQNTDFDSEFKNKYNKEIERLQYIDTDNLNKEHEQKASTITSEGVNPVVDDSKSNDDVEKEKTIVENNISPESLPEVGDIKNEDAKALITDRDEKIAVLDKINKLSDNIAKPTDAYYVKKDGKQSMLARVSNVIQKAFNNHGIDDKPIADSRQRLADKHYKNTLENATPDERKYIESQKSKIIEDKKTELRNQQLENNNTVSTEVGNVFDKMIKNVLLGVSTDDLRDNFVENAYEKALSDANKIAEEINPSRDTDGKIIPEKLRSKVYAKDLFLHTTNANIKGYDGVAGSTDVVTVDKDGKVTIWDLKTTAGDYKGGHDQQLSSYAIMLNNTYGIKADALKIIDLKVKYTGDAKNFDISGSEFRGIKNIDSILASTGKNNELKLKDFDGISNDSPGNNNTPGLEYRQPSIYSALKNVDVYSDASNKTNLLPGSEITLRTTDKHQKDKERNADTVNVEMVDGDGNVVGAIRYGDAKLSPEEQIKIKDIRNRLWNQPEISGVRTLKTMVDTDVEQKLARTMDKGGFLGERPGREDMVIAGRYISSDIDELKTESSDKTEKGTINYIKKDQVVNYDSMKKAVTYILVPLNTNDKNTKYQAVEAINKPIKEMKEGEIKNAFIQTLFQFVKSQASNSLDSITISSDDIQNISNITYEKDVSKALSAATLATEKKTPYNAVFFLSQELVHISSENGKVYQDVITYGEINEGGKYIDDKVRKMIGFIKPQFRYDTSSISLMTGEKSSRSFGLSKVLNDFVSTTLSKNVTFEALQEQYKVKGIKAGFYSQVSFEIKPVEEVAKKNIEVIAPKISDEDREAFHLFNDMLELGILEKLNENCA